MKQEIKEKRALIKAAKVLNEAFDVVKSDIGFNQDDFAMDRKTIVFVVKRKK